VSGDTIEVNEGLLMAGRSWRGGWTREQFDLLGVAWPPAADWKALVVGTRIRLEAAQAFIDSREMRLLPRHRPRNEILGMLH